MDSELMRIEAELERLSPGSLPEGLISRMEAAMEGWEEVPEAVPDAITEEADKVVPFPLGPLGPLGDADRESMGGRRGGTGMWAAAASVALLGATAGLMFTGKDQANQERSTGVIPTPGVRKVDFSPQAAKRTILDASDRDVIIPNGAQPLRVMRLDYVDRVVFRNAAGEEIHVEVPSVNYRLVPLSTD